MGTYISLAVLNRVVAPASKLGFEPWAERTVLDRLCPVKTKALDHRRFWDAMDQITLNHMKDIEERVTGTIIGRFNIDLSGLVLDMCELCHLHRLSQHQGIYRPTWSCQTEAC